MLASHAAVLAERAKYANSVRMDARQVRIHASSVLSFAKSVVSRESRSRPSSCCATCVVPLRRIGGGALESGEDPLITGFMCESKGSFMPKEVAEGFNGRSVAKGDAAVFGCS